MRKGIRTRNSRYGIRATNLSENWWFQEVPHILNRVQRVLGMLQYGIKAIGYNTGLYGPEISLYKKKLQLYMKCLTKCLHEKNLGKCVEACNWL
jgi:hypothetical protein